MRTTRSLSLPLEGDSGLGAFLRRHVAILGGLAIGTAVAAAAATLATWTVDDPSLSHTTKVQPRNLLGYPGAIASDLLMQFLGIASIVMLIAPGLWAWRALMRARGLPRRSTVIAWALGTVVGAAALSALTPPKTWPLPTGLGGVIGDLILRLPLLNAAAVQGSLAGMLVAPMAAALGLALLAFACGMHLRRAPAQDRDEPDAEPATEGGISARLALAAGAILHGAIRLASLLRRGMSATATRVRERRVQESFDIEERIEPSLAGLDLPEDDEEESEAPPRPVSVKSARPAKPPINIAGVFRLPPLPLLVEPRSSGAKALSADALEQNARLLEGVLDDFGVRGDIVHVRPGPVVTLYELEPAPGIKSSRVVGLSDDIARSMSAVACRVAVIPGKNAIGIELPNARRETVFLRELIAAEDFGGTKARLPLGLGKTIGGEPVVADLAKMPHLLIAGTTGSGKSVAINTMILSLLYRLTPAECRLIMIDPKMLELSTYEGIPHLLTPVVTDPKKAVVALKWTVREMEDRYRKMSKVGVRNIDGLNARVAEAVAKGETLTRTVQTGFDPETGQAVYEQEELPLTPMPYIVVIIDEMADLMMVAGKEIEGAVQRLAQMARAAGIHVIMATQRPSVDVITGTIKANFPTRISFQVTSKIDSRTILGEQGAEQLLGQGDMLYMMGGGRITRVHGPFVSDVEVEKVVAHLKAQGSPDYLEAITADDGEDGDEAGGMMPGEDGEEGADLYDKAVAVVLRDRKASTSYIQRRLQIGYNRAASIIERMEKEGLVGAANHAGKREILVEAREEEF